jgi:hypothetical protein
VRAAFPIVPAHGQEIGEAIDDRQPNTMIGRDSGGRIPSDRAVLKPSSLDFAPLRAEFLASMATRD